MNFHLREARQILERTPSALSALLTGVSGEWLNSREGEGTWSAAEVVGHLVEGERSNWIPRLEWMLREGESKPFPPFDRDAHLEEASAGDPIEERLRVFRELRAANLARLAELVGDGPQLEAAGRHPAFGTVKARELISTWVVHDLAHTAQIARVMAKRYSADVGPWIEYLGILRK